VFHILQDGDKFWVIWDERLVPKTREPPSRYLPSPQMPDEDRTLTLQVGVKLSGLASSSADLRKDRRSVKLSELASQKL
jgi:hypothetical protein